MSQPDGSPRLDVGAAARFGQQIALVPAQKVMELAIAVLTLRKEKGGCVAGNSLRKPLVMVGSPVQQIAPPLMGDLVGDDLSSHRIIPAPAEAQLRAFSFGQEGERWQVDQFRPSLPKCSWRLGNRQ